MQVNQLFPFELIAKGSKVLIYGMGVLGRLYIEQIELTGWCRIIGVMDKIAGKEYGQYPYIPLEGLKEHEKYDYIVIAVTQVEIAKMLVNQFIEVGIPEKKIVSHHLRYGLELKSSRKNPSADDTRPLTAQIVITGGIGDAVMETSFYERLVSIVPDIIIDVYGESYCKEIYCHKKNVRNIYNLRSDVPDEEYDVILSSHWGVTIHACNYQRVRRKSPELYNKIVETEKEITYWRSEEAGKGLYLRLQREALRGVDKFEMMGRRDIWALSPKMIKLELDEQYKKSFESLNLQKYITINCGADMRMFKDMHLYPTKVWPKEHFERFIRLFKEKYPEYEVVQIGAKGLAEISGADRYYLGESLELAKYILKHSFLHIDDEGGLVHMGTALGTKCAVLFGPTPESVLGYANNINISTDVCRGCFGLVGEWNVKCALGMEKPMCMYSIQPEMVMEKIEKYMRNGIWGSIEKGQKRHD